MQYADNRYSLPPVVKNLLIINAIFFIATEFLRTSIGGTIMEYGGQASVYEDYSEELRRALSAL